MNILQQKRSQYADITVYETNQLYGEHGRFRVLQFANDDVQGALDLNNPQRIVFEYPRAIIHLLEHNVSSLEQLFIIGQGIGTLGRYFAERQLQIAELDEVVAQMSVDYFGSLPESILIGDGRELLSRQPNSNYDAIILDAFSEAGTPAHLVSLESLQMMTAKLHKRGCIVMNLIGRGLHDVRVNAIYTTLNEWFPYIRCFQLPVEKNSDVRNIVMIGSHSPIRYQIKQMAGFLEYQPQYAYVLRD